MVPFIRGVKASALGSELAHAVREADHKAGRFWYWAADKKLDDTVASYNADALGFEDGAIPLALTSDGVLAFSDWPLRLYRLRSVSPEPDVAFHDVMPYENRIVFAESIQRDESGWDEIESSQVVFGRNGRQVVTVLEWWRDRARVRPDVITSVNSHYDRRAQLRFPAGPGDAQSAFRGDSWPLAKKVSVLPWRAGSRLASDWADAVHLALYHNRFWACRFLASISPALIALALRDVIEPPKFDVLYAGLAPYYPIATLDAEIQPVGFKA